MDKDNIFIIAAEKYLSEGLSVLPTNNEKGPAVSTWTSFQSCRMSSEQAGRDFKQPNVQGIGIIGGKISGNLEVIDIDTKHDDSGTLWQDFKSLIQNAAPGLLERLVIAGTRNNGFHLYYRCAVIDRNQKLAKKENKEVLIETRGEGGYVIACPSAGYSFTQGDTSAIPEITPDERQSLFTVAKCFNRLFEKVREKKVSTAQEYTSPGLSAFDDYNQRADIPALLEKHGWKIVAEHGPRIVMLRPGNTDSKTSGNFHTDLRIFFCFSSSTAFETDKGYNPVQVYALLECDNDFSRASHQLYNEGYGDRRTAQLMESQPTNGVTQSGNTPADTFAEFIPDWTNKPPYVPPVLKLAGINILTHQNISVVIAAPGSGKTSCIEAIAASYLNPQADCLGFEVDRSCRGVLLIDTERTKTDVWNSFYRMCRRAGIQEGGNIANVKIIGMRGVSDPGKRKEVIEKHITGREYSLLLIDGVADLVNDTNNVEQAKNAQDWLKSLTANYDLSIFTTIHPNPGSTKARGHTGGELLRDAETVLSIKDFEGAKIVTSDFEYGKNRNAAKMTHGFKWSDELMMFVSVDYEGLRDEKKAAKDEAKRREAEILAKKVLAPPTAKTYTQLTDDIMFETGHSQKTAQNRIADMKGWRIISKTDDYYRLML